MIRENFPLEKTHYTVTNFEYIELWLFYKSISIFINLSSSIKRI